MDQASRVNPDFRAIFESLPGCFLILLPDAPRFTIVAVSDAYAKATNTTREQILGRPVFDVFPDNPDDPKTTGMKNVTASFTRVIESKSIDFMPIQKYDIHLAGSTDFEVRYWSPDNSPVIGKDGKVIYIIHHVTDVTENEKMLRMYGDNATTSSGADQDLTQIQRLQNLMVDRELRMADLKADLARLKDKSSAPQ